MDAAGYMADLLDDQIGWYDRKSLSNQNWHKRLRMLQVLAAALIRFLTAYLPPDKSTTQIGRWAPGGSDRGRDCHAGSVALPGTLDTVQDDRASP